MLGNSTLADQHIDTALKLFNEDSYNQNRMVEVQHQLYLRDLEKLKVEIGCFL